MYIVYCTTNLSNNYIYVGVHKCTSLDDQYIGCGCFKDQPSTYSNPKTKFQAAVKNFGVQNFKRTIIKIFDNEEDAYSLEAEIVNNDFLKRTDVYNQVLGGNGGDRGINAVPCYKYDLDGNFIEEYSSQQDAANSVNRCVSSIKAAIANKKQSGGYYFTLEKVAKLDLSLYGLSNKIPVFQFTDQGDYELCFESVSEAAKSINVSTSNLVRAIKLGYKIKNKHFSYEFNVKYPTIKQQISKNCPVFQYDLDGNFIKEWNSYTEAEKALNKKAGLKQALALNHTFANYQWSLTKEEKLQKVELVHKAHKVGQYSTDGQLIKIYSTVTECTKDFSGCRGVLQGRRKTSGGFVFKYIND